MMEDAIFELGRDIISGFFYLKGISSFLNEACCLRSNVYDVSSSGLILSLDMSII